MKKRSENPKIVSQYELLKMVKNGDKNAEEEMRRRMTLLDDATGKSKTSDSGGKSGKT